MECLLYIPHDGIVAVAGGSSTPLVLELTSNISEILMSPHQLQHYYLYYKLKVITLIPQVCLLRNAEECVNIGVAQKKTTQTYHQIW